MSASPPLAAPTGQKLEPVAADALIERHLLGVWRYLRMHGASAHEADDLAQEAFVIALQKNAARLEPAATSTFLRRTARFLFLRLRRDHHAAIELADVVDALWARDCDRDDGEGLLASLRVCLGVWDTGTVSANLAAVECSVLRLEPTFTMRSRCSIDAVSSRGPDS